MGSYFTMYHNIPLYKIWLTFLVICGVCASTGESDPNFYQNYEVSWGNNFHDYGSQVQIYLDYSSGSGFWSKSYFGSGFFQMKIKVPKRDCGGVVTAYYLASGDENDRDELDFEFLGNRENKTIVLQTNVFVNGLGGREHRVDLSWFDPTADYHTYKILWNQHHIVFFVDNIPIRYFNNNKRRYGVGYPTQAMRVQVSIWNGESWATDGGKTKIIWDNAPFKADFEGFDINGCQVDHKGGRLKPCHSENYWWNKERYWELNRTEKQAYEIVKHHYVTYDYCYDKEKNVRVLYPECSLQ